MTNDQQPTGTGPRDQEELLRLRQTVARLRDERDAALVTRVQNVPGRGARWLRWMASVVLVVVASLLAFATVPGFYLRTQLLDTDNYMANVAPLASDAAIQAEISNQVTAQITEAVDVEAITRQALTELTRSTPRVAAAITGLAPVIAAQTTSLVHSTVSNFVASPAFNDLWLQLNRTAHQNLVSFVRGEPGVAVTIDESGTVSISTQVIIDRVKDRLLQNGVGIAARIPAVDGQITLFQSSELVRAVRAINALDRIAPLLAWLTLLCAAGAVVTAPRGGRRRAIGSVGVGLSAAMALLILGLGLGRILYLGAVPADALSPSAAQSLIDAFLLPLRNIVRVAFVASLLIALAAFLSGPTRAAGVVRGVFVRAGDRLSGKGASVHIRPWQRRLVRQRRILQVALGGVAVLVLIFWQEPTAAVLIWTAVVTALAILLVEILARPAVIEERVAPSREPDTLI